MFFKLHYIYTNITSDTQWFTLYEFMNEYIYYVLYLNNIVYKL